jgi:hypothetical protein
MVKPLYPYEWLGKLVKRPMTGIRLRISASKRLAVREWCLAIVPDLNIRSIQSKGAQSKGAE